MAVAFGLDTVVVAPEKRPVSSSYASRLGILAITAEVGCNGTVSEDKVFLHYNSVIRIMGYLGILQSPPLPGASVPKFVKLSVPIASTDGLCYPRKHVGAHVVKNDVLGEVRDVFGKFLILL
ncbi:hypothetical protein BGW36DRAFT_150358 [Talaromyces proteolyticus]|uniref:Uncharacterized protein n=1 Tax=Talaromyces proteolyticus TaxID=1131652 RepID=A0AAD4KU04_9EURO|nr:uncharacterized protein BGW36DRAFT_150358 [Talaromyces proteolyticus]KAH8698770.1 hypothetical protein BGW36DRAFT_150358 [Talaromyces proteolyticus]